MRGCGERVGAVNPRRRGPPRPSPRRGGCSGSRGRPSHSGREGRARPRPPRLPVLAGGLALRHRSVRSVSGRGGRRGRARSVGGGRGRRHGAPGLSADEWAVGRWGRSWEPAGASRGLQIPQGYAAGYPPSPRIGHRQPGKDPTPRVATNSAHTAPGKPSIDIYLIQSFLIHTVDGPPVPLRAWGRGRGPGQTVTR